MANEHGNATLRGCMFVGNQASKGGGLYNAEGNSFLSNCVFADNSATSGRAAGCDRVNVPSKIDVTNSILWDGGNETWYGTGAKITVAFSDVRGGCAGPGCMDLDPYFTRGPDPGTDATWGTADDDAGDLRLVLGSPCIDAGDNAGVTPEAIADPDGNPRIVDGDDDGIAAVDMGAYEFQGSTEAIPAMTDWGLLAMALLVLTAGTVVLVRRRVAAQVRVRHRHKSFRFRRSSLWEGKICSVQSSSVPSSC